MFGMAEIILIITVLVLAYLIYWITKSIIKFKRSLK